MNTTPQLILVASPDPTLRELLEMMLEDEVEVVLATSADECLEFIHYKPPDVILLEPCFHGFNGHLLCHSIREKLTKSSTSIIVLSSITLIEEKLEYFRNGCDEFISTPFHPEEVITKTRMALEIRHIQHKMEVQNKKNKETALAALEQCNEMGVILRFMEECLHVKSFAHLGRELLTTCKDFGLDAVVLFQTYAGEKAIGAKIDSKEIGTIAMHRDHGRFYEVENWLLANQSEVSLLIRNMPNKTESRYGELKDVIGILLNSLTARIETLNTELAFREEKSQGANSSLKSSQNKIVSIQKKLSNYTDQFNVVSHSLHGYMRDICFSMGLDDKQEEMLLDMVEVSLEKLEVSFRDVLEIEQYFTTLVDDLKVLLDAETKSSDSDEGENTG